MSELATSIGDELPQREAQWSQGGERAATGDLELTGDPGVDAALARLVSLDRDVDPYLDPAGQLPVLAEIHEALQQRLSSTEG